MISYDTESILTSVKKLIGIEGDYPHFDADLIMHINSVLFILTQMGIGRPEGLIISDKSATWADFVGESQVNLSAAKTYTYLKVKSMFDPPQSSSVAESQDRILAELEWRLNIAAESEHI